MSDTEINSSSHIGRVVTRFFSVSELNQRARNLLEASFELLWVQGEVSNATRAASGHWYFSLKDQAAQVRCVLFRHKAAASECTPANGAQVEALVLPSLYEARGEFQLGVELLRPAGLGAWFAAFERLKAKLAAEGLFAPERKRALPAFPRTLGVVTSLQAAALQDVLTTLRRKAPMLRVIIYPASVQGAGAVGELCAAILRASERRECDALIVCRGGGSLEDMAAFNHEEVARAIAGCPIPVVTGVGHETDFTIADFAADRRAATPTAAAELLAPSRSDLLVRWVELSQALTRTTHRGLLARQQRLDQARRSLLSPAAQLVLARARLGAAGAELVAMRARSMQAERTRLDLARGQLRPPDLRAARLALGQHDVGLHHALARGLAAARARCAEARARLEGVNPDRILALGYSIAFDAQGAPVRSAARLHPKDALRLVFAQGGATVSVDAVSVPSPAREGRKPGV